MHESVLNIFRIKISLHVESKTIKFYCTWCPKNKFKSNSMSPKVNLYLFGCPRQPNCIPFLCHQQPNFTQFVCPRQPNFNPFLCPWQLLIKVHCTWPAGGQPQQKPGPGLHITVLAAIPKRDSAGILLVAAKGATNDLCFQLPNLSYPDCN